MGQCPVAEGRRTSNANMTGALASSFGLAEKSNFRGLDLLAAGPVAPAVSG